jgi:seryl-tRNA synthetase
MLALQFLRENKEAILKGLEKRNFKQPELIDSIIELDQERRSQQATLDQQLARANQLAKEIGSLFKNGEAEKATGLKRRNGQPSNHKLKRFKNNYKKLQMRFLN